MLSCAVLEAASPLLRSQAQTKTGCGLAEINPELGQFAVNPALRLGAVAYVDLWRQQRLQAAIDLITNWLLPRAA